MCVQIKTLYTGVINLLSLCCRIWTSFSRFPAFLILRVVGCLIVETCSEGDDFPKRRNFTVEMVHFGAFSVAMGAAVTGIDVPHPLSLIHI